VPQISVYPIAKPKVSDTIFAPGSKRLDDNFKSPLPVSTTTCPA